MKTRLLLIILLPILTFGQNVIEMEEHQGIYMIPCKVNGIPMKFIFDTGASEVSISITEAKFLYKQGLLKDDEIVGSANYQIANGDILEGTKIKIKSILIGDVELNNISASVIHSPNAPLLLGQSAINKLGEFTINGNKLIMGNNSTESKLSTSYLDEKYGFKLYKFDQPVDKEYWWDEKRIVQEDSNSYLYLISDNGEIQKVFDLKMDVALASLSKPNKLVETVILKKYYTSTAEKPQTQNFEDFEYLQSSFEEIIGKSTYTADDKNLVYVNDWTGKKVQLRITHNLKDEIKFVDNGKLEIISSITIVFYKMINTKKIDLLKGF